LLSRYCFGSDVARVPCVWEAKKIFAPLPTKTAEFEVKITAKAEKKTKVDHLLFVTSIIFRSNKLHLTLERTRQAGVTTWRSGNGAPTLWQFYSLFSKNCTFFGIFWSKISF